MLVWQARDARDEPDVPGDIIAAPYGDGRRRPAEYGTYATSRRSSPARPCWCQAVGNCSRRAPDPSDAVRSARVPPLHRVQDAP